MTQARAWQRMLSGRRLDLLDPSPLDIEIADVAHGLAFVARWNGQTSGDWPYSVAEHSLLVERILVWLNPGIAARWRMAALVHDAPEYVIGDMISPVKSRLGPGYAELEARLMRAVHLRCGLPAEIPSTIQARIKQADRLSAWMEAVELAGFSQDEANALFGRPLPGLREAMSIALRPPALVRVDFIARHGALQQAIEDEARAGPFSGCAGR